MNKESFNKKELAKVYDPVEVEDKWYKYWTDNGHFAADCDGEATPYSIVIPPPNVTGSLHMGHALNNTLQDIMARFKRMQGFNVLWLPGTDHAGIATQNVVEKKLALQKEARQTLGRELFVKRVWEWKEEYGDIITIDVCTVYSYIVSSGIAEIFACLYNPHVRECFFYILYCAVSG